ncbi:uncharacterized protein [Gossypium hirsutum]|uniref:RNase H type-1 domain-containing protein n=1 Tax=Gossypium hirsutum TaxID=3635 RepID=A0A1U8HN72_GOSHI|nr:uncharacterized protein LOC107887777 [Gossypium hirsutum]
MAIKVDLEKAYDLRWDFIEDTLVDVGFPSNLSRIIMKCITTVSMQIMWNGKLSNEFSEKGVLGFRQTDDLGIYLGMPLFHRQVTMNTFKFVMDKVKRKLNNWNAKMLSMARWVTLALSVLLSIPNYFMQTLKIPSSICVEIKKIAWGCIWGSSAANQKPHLLGFNLLTNKQALWVKVLRAKYKLFEDRPEDILGSKCSFVWRSLAKVWSLLRQSLLWSIGDGNLIKFWTDSWLTEVGLLINYCLDHSLIDESVTLQEVVTRRQAELWAICEGLQLAWEANWENVIVETDCALAIKGFPIGARIFHVAPSLVDNQIWLDRRFLLSNPVATVSS